MKRIISVLTVAVLAVGAMVTPVFAGGHGGGHHGSYRNQTTYTASIQAVPLAAAICEVTDCSIIGEHQHDGGNIVAHYYGDGHENHAQSSHTYHAGEIHH